MGDRDHVLLDALLPERPEVLWLARQTGRSVPEVVGLIVSLWCWATRCGRAGVLWGVDAKILAQKVGGDTDFWALAHKAGLIHVTKQGLRVSEREAALSPARRKKLGTGRKNGTPKADDGLWRAMCEVCEVDSSLRHVRSAIADAVAALRKADPPYTPDEVREFGRRVREMSWWTDEHTITPHVVAKWIWVVRRPAKTRSLDDILRAAFSRSGGNGK